jgi:hypothetical protein
MFILPELETQDISLSCMIIIDHIFYKLNMVPFLNHLCDANTQKYQNHWYAETCTDNRKFGTNYIN